MRILLAATIMASVSILVACSSDSTKIQAESTGPSGSGGHHTQGAGGASSASASSSGSGAGGNGVGAGHVITADTDSKQLVTGTFSGSTITPGPFVITDFRSNNGSATGWVLPGPACDAESDRTALFSGGEVHGLHIFVPVGSTACTEAAAFGSYSGFKPY